MLKWIQITSRTNRKKTPNKVGWDKIVVKLVILENDGHRRTSSDGAKYQHLHVKLIGVLHDLKVVCERQLDCQIAFNTKYHLICYAKEGISILKKLY